MMKAILENDPKRYIRVKSDPLHLINKKNTHGQSPLYIASKNGNLEVLKFLLDNEANFDHSPFIVEEENFTETPLQAACRWGHKDIVSFLLTRFKFTMEELENCLNSTENKEILKLLRQKGARRQLDIKAFLTLKFWCGGL